MKNILTKTIISFGIILLSILLPVQAARAETLEEQLNNLIGPKKQYNTALSPVYLRNSASEESISTQSGDLMLIQTDYTLPGKNGLDLEIKRIYKSGISNIQEMKAKYVDGAWVDYVYSDANTTSFYEERYNLGIGMRFSFPAIEIKKNTDGSSHKYLHTDTGDVYRLYDPIPKDGIEEYEPENQTIKDVTINISSDFSNGQDDGISKYVMINKYGKKTYFADDGRILGIVDRYGNTIKFEYTTFEYKIDGVKRTRKLITRITDTIGRVITIEYKEDATYTVDPINNTVYGMEESYKASQNPNTMDSGDLEGKFQVILYLPGGRKIVYDKTAALVSPKKHVLRTRLQRVFDVDGKPKYHFWYEQPSLGFSFTRKTGYSAYNTYENLVQVDYCRNNRIKRYTYSTFTKGLSDGSMQYRKIFEEKELAKTGYDTSKTDFLERFVCDVKDKVNYSYTNEADGYNFSGYKESNNTYLKDTYRYYSDRTDLNGTTVKYTYNGLHELMLTEETGENHRKTILVENDEMKFPKKTEETRYNVVNGEVVGNPSVKIENFRYDQYGNLTNYTGPLARRDESGYPVDMEHTVIYSYAYDKFHTMSQKSWKQDKDTACQIIYIIDDKGNVIKEQKLNTDDPVSWITTDYQYDGNGNMTQKTVHSSDNTYITCYEYGIDADGNDHKGAYLTKEYKIVNGEELAKKYVYDSDTGNKKADIDENGNRTGYEYDILERLIKTTYADLTFKQYKYNDYANSNKEMEYTDPGGFRYIYEYDIFDNIIRCSLFDNGKWNTLTETAFDFRGNKTEETDSNGNKTVFTYDSCNRLTGKTYYEKDKVKKEGITLSYTLGINEDISLMLTITDEDGYAKRYYYNAADQLVKLEETPDKTNYFTRTYTYDYIGSLTSETDPLNATTEYVYDNLGRLVKRIDALQNETIYSYNSIDKMLTEEAAGGKITEKIYDVSGREIEERIYTKGSGDYYYKKYQYDRTGNITALKEGKVEDGRDGLSSMTEYAYDAMNRVADEYRHIEPGRRGRIHHSYDTNGYRTELVEYAEQTGDKYLKYTYSYDFAGRVVREDGAYIDNGSPDASAMRGNYLVKYTRDYEGNVLKEERYNGETFNITLYGYDYRNRCTSKIEPYTADGKTKQTSWTFDKRGNIISETIIKQGIPCTVTYRYDGRGKLVEKTDAMKNTTGYIYDDNGNLKKEIDPRYYGIGADAAPGTEYTYDAVGRLVKTVLFDGNNRTVISYKEYDGRGNVVKEADGEGYDKEEPHLSVGKAYEYDAADRVITYISAQTVKDSNSPNGIFAKKYMYDGSKRVISEQDSRGGKTVRTYYTNGQLKEIIYPDGSKEEYEYDDTGKLSAVKTDQRGNRTTTYNNVFGKACRIEYPDNTFETFKYTADGHLQESRNRNGNINTFEYDPSGNMTAKREFIKTEGDINFNRLTRYENDEDGLLLSSETFTLMESITTGRELSVESAEDVVQYTYDKAGRLTEVYGPYGRETINRYDAAGNITATIQKISDGEYKVRRFEYDARSRKIKESLLLDTSEIDNTQLRGAEFDDEYASMVKSTTTYTYYANDLVKSMKDPRGNETVIEYDLDGRPVKKLQPLQIATTYRYDTEGNLTCETNGRGASTYYEYDCMNRLIRKKTPAPSGGQAVALYIYDAAGSLVKTILPNEYRDEMDTPEQALLMKGTAYTYDSMNRQTSMIAPTGETIRYIAYDGNGNVIKEVDGPSYNGSMDESPGTVYKYDGLNRVVKKIDELGGITSSKYDILGNLTRQTNVLGHSTDYEYNPDGTVAKITYPDGGIITFAYDKLGRVTSRTDQRGNSTRFVYNAFDRLKEEIDPYGFSILHKYDLAGNECKITDKKGSTAYTSYDALNRPAEKRIPLEVDGTGNVLYGIERYAYDEAGNISSITRTGTKDPRFVRGTVYTYYDGNQVKSMSDNNGSYIAYYYDKNGNMTKKETLRDIVDGIAKYDIEKYSYDCMDRMTESIRLVEAEDLHIASGIPNHEELSDEEYPGKVKLITGYKYDILGNKLNETSPMAYAYKADDAVNRDNHTVNYAYDELNRLVQIARKYNGRDVTVSYVYDAEGNMIAEENERGFTTRYAYDSMNRLKTQTDSLGNTISFKCDLAGNMTAVTNAKGHTMTYTYDMLNREENVIDAYGTVISRKLYDANGNIVKAIDAKGYLSGSNDEARYGVLYTYDLANRLSGLAKPEAAAVGRLTETYEYNQFGDRIKVTDALGNTTAFEYDNGGNLIKVTDPLGIATTYGYDKAGGKLYMIDGRGKITTYSYNALGEIKIMTDAEGCSIAYQYDMAGNLKRTVDRNSNITLFYYDNRNLLLEKKVESATGAAISYTTGAAISYTYDETGNRTGMSDESGTYTYSYDGENRLERIMKDGSLQIRYTYDEIGNIATVTDKLGFTVSYTYDRSSRMETVSYKGQSVSYAYDINGNRESVTYSSGIRTTYRYDRENKLLEIINHKPGGGIISTYGYTYNLAGRQLTKRDNYGATAYTYDAAGRILKEETPGKTAVYFYDKAGNRISMNETYVSEQSTGFIDNASAEEIKYIIKKTEYVYSASNRLIKLVEKHCAPDGKVLLTQNTVYIYDGNGNQLRQSSSYISSSSIKARQTLRGTAYGEGVDTEFDQLISRTSNTYDGFNRLKRTEQIKAGVRTIAEYTYNGDDLRVEKTTRKSDNGYTPETTVFLYDRQHVILETDAGGNLKARYIRGINYLACETLQSGSLSIILYNGHGDVTQTTDNAGNILNNYDYDIWGNPMLTIEQHACGIRYAGEYLDKETSLYYLRARYYNPYIGRFISEDSYWGEDENPLSLNLYTYCYNNPMMYIDPTGHYSYLIYCADGSVIESDIIVDGNSPYYDTGLKNSGVFIYADANVTVSGDTPGIGVMSENITATINTSGDVGKVHVSKGSSVTINNVGNIGDITTGYKSSSVIRNVGSISRISTGTESSTEIENRLIIEEITTGYDSHSNINNVGAITKIRTGIDNETVINNRGYIGKIETGYGSHSNIINYNSITSISATPYSKTEVNNRGRIETILVKSNSYIDVYNEARGKIFNIDAIQDGNLKLRNYGYVDSLMRSLSSEIDILNYKGGLLKNDETILTYEQVLFMFSMGTLGVNFDDGMQVLRTIVTNGGTISGDELIRIGLMKRRNESDTYPEDVAYFLANAYKMNKMGKTPVELQIAEQNKRFVEGIALSALNIVNTIGKGKKNIKEQNYRPYNLDKKNRADSNASKTGAEGAGKVVDDLPTGGKITGYTKHGTEQALGRDGGIGVSNKAITDAVNNPVKPPVPQSGGTTKYIGKDATVVLNQDGKVVTTWANSSAGTR